MTALVLASPPTAPPHAGRVIAGIDPGVSGAIALLDLTTCALAIHDMPTLQAGKRCNVDGLLLISISNLRGHHAEA